MGCVACADRRRSRGAAEKRTQSADPDPSGALPQWRCRPGQKGCSSRRIWYWPAHRVLGRGSAAPPAGCHGGLRAACGDAVALRHGCMPPRGERYQGQPTETLPELLVPHCAPFPALVEHRAEHTRRAAGQVAERLAADSARRCCLLVMKRRSALQRTALFARNLAIQRRRCLPSLVRISLPPSH